VLAAWSVTALYEVTGFLPLPPSIEGRDLGRFLSELLGPGLAARGVGPMAAPPG